MKQLQQQQHSDKTVGVYILQATLMTEKYLYKQI